MYTNSFISYVNKTYKISYKYTIEYIDDPKTWDKYINNNYQCEPWELYQIKEFDNMPDAISLYIKYYLSDQVYDVKCFEQIYINDELCREAYIEMEATFSYSMKKIINSGLQERNNNLIKENEQMKKELLLYNDFIKKYNSEELFKKYKWEGSNCN